MRLLVTGARGMLGRAVEAEGLQRGFPVLGLSRSELDVTDMDQVEKIFLRERPEAVVHCAAFTDVDGAERDEASAFRVNGLGAAHVARAAAGIGAVVLYVSTDYVMDGQASVPYPTSASPAPQGAYGRTKLAGEWAVQASRSPWIVVRTSWLYGAGGANFVDTIRDLGRTRPRLRVVDDQKGRPTWTGSLAPALLDLLEREARGLYHVADSGECSWYELALEVLRLSGVDTPVDRVSTEEYGAEAPRPGYSVLDLAQAVEVLERRLPQWQDSLAKYLGAGEPDVGSAPA